MRDYFEKEICTNCCIDKQFCERCGVRKKTANPEKEKPALMARLQESDKNCDGNCKNCVAICGTTQNTIFLEAADAIEELLAAVPKWISVEERLPDEWREVLTHSPIHSDEKNPHMIQLCWYIGNGKWRECQYGEIMEIPITHWMSLPEPPKEETDG